MKWIPFKRTKLYIFTLYSNILIVLIDIPGIISMIISTLIFTAIFVPDGFDF